MGRHAYHGDHPLAMLRLFRRPWGCTLGVIAALPDQNAAMAAITTTITITQRDLNCLSSLRVSLPETFRGMILVSQPIREKNGGIMKHCRESSDDGHICEHASSNNT